jgi:hypothetical protein
MMRRRGARRCGFQPGCESVEGRVLLAGQKVAYLVAGLGGAPFPADFVSALNAQGFDTHFAFWNSIDPRAPGNEPGSLGYDVGTGGVQLKIDLGVPNTPDEFVNDLVQTLDTRYDNNDTIVLIGQGLGADALLQVARRATVQIDLLGLLDPAGSIDAVAERSYLNAQANLPIFGSIASQLLAKAVNSDGRIPGFRKDLGAAPSNVQYLYNRWQTNGPFPFDPSQSALLVDASQRSLSADFGIADQAVSNTERAADGTPIARPMGPYETLFQLGASGVTTAHIDEGFAADPLTESELERIIARLPRAFFAQAGAPSAVPEGATATLVGDHSQSPDGGPLSYQWAQVDGPQTVGLSSPSAADPTFVAPVGGVYHFKLTVTDTTGQSTSDEVAVLVNNLPPQAGPIVGPAHPRRWAPVSFGVHVSDPGPGDALQVSWDFGDGTVTPFQAVAAPSGNVASPSHAFASSGQFLVRATVRDQNGATSVSGFRVILGATPGDYDGDGKTDLATFRLANATWSIFNSSSGPHAFSFGQPGDVPVPADYEGIGKVDPAVYRPSTGQWIIALSTGGVRTFTLGASSSDIPVPADYDGDGKADPAIYRPGTGQWILLQSTAGPSVVSFGAPGDRPVPADYDGDGKADIAVYRPKTGQWFLRQSTAGVKVVTFGAPNLDVPIPADYDGDGKADLAVYRPTTSQFLILQSSAGPRVVRFGAPGLDIPLTGDFDGDGKIDIALYRPTTGQWLILQSTAGARIVTFGAPRQDVPLPTPLAYRSQGALAQSASLGGSQSSAFLVG